MMYLQHNTEMLVICCLLTGNGTTKVIKIFLALLQSTNQFLKWPKWHSHCKDHRLGDVSKLHQDIVVRIKKNVLTVDEKLTVNLQRRRQLAVCSRCLGPQPQKLGCRLLTVSLAVVILRYHEAVGVGREEWLSSWQIVDADQRTKVAWCVAM